jgi:Phospholipase_D-nuclease N-terminal
MYVTCYGRTALLAAFPLNWLETTILVVIWMALFVDVIRQHWLSSAGKIAWIVFILVVPLVSWIAYGIVRHRHGVGRNQTLRKPCPAGR